jgi:imidazolonepropionase-like amidohydrolase
VCLVSASAQAQRPVAITGVTVIHADRSGAAIVEPNRTVTISAGRIQAVGPSSSTKVPEAAEVINGKDKWLIPGFIDSHVHFFQSANPYTRPDGFDLTKRVPYAQEDARNRARLPATFKVWLASGVTSVLDAGGPFWNFTVRDTAQNSPTAPRVAVAGPLLSMVDDPQLDNGDPPIIKVSTPEEAVALAKKELARRPDYVKVWFIHEPSDDLARQEAIVKATAETTHAAGVLLAVHATELETAKAAVRAGADLLVHSVIDRPVDEEFLRMVRERHVLYTPTLYVFRGGAEMATGNWHETEVERKFADPQVLATMHDYEKIPVAELPQNLQNALRFKGQALPAQVVEQWSIPLKNLLSVWQADITVTMGTDAGNPGVLHGPSIFREMELMASAGLTPAQILRAATTNGARAMRLDAKLGRIAPGQLADLVLLDADPLADVKNLNKISRVIKGGIVYDPTQLISSLQ